MAAILAVVVSAVVWRGCAWRDQTTNDDDLEAKQREKEKKEKPKPDFEPLTLALHPAPLRSMGGWYKPGHWMTASLAAKANHFDFLGDVELAVVDSTGANPGLTASTYEMDTFRTLALPKAQPKAAESVLYFPVDCPPAWVLGRLLSRNTGLPVLETAQPFLAMPSFQYYMVVLARQPEQYAYLSALEAVRPPADRTSFNPTVSSPYYRVVLLSSSQRPPLPPNVMCWTSIAYLIWDDVTPDVLDPQQRQALVDWLH